MTEFETLRIDMDAQVENRLGDTFSYSVDGADFVDMVGFVTKAGDDGGIDGLTSIPTRWYVKMPKTALEGVPSRRDRIRTPKLPGTWRPAVDADDVQSEGQSWKFEIQRAKGS